MDVQKKKYFVPSLKRTVTVTVSARGTKVIDVRGIESVGRAGSSTETELETTIEGR